MSKKSGGEVFLGCIGILAYTVALSFITVALNGWALSTLWGWFIVPTFNARPLTIIQSVGVALIVSFVARCSHKSDDSDKDKDATTRLIEAGAQAVLAPLLSVGFGWVVLLFA